MRERSDRGRFGGRDDGGEDGVGEVVSPHAMLGFEMAAAGMTKRRGDTDLDAERVGSMRLALADAFDLRSVQRIDLAAGSF